MVDFNKYRKSKDDLNRLVNEMEKQNSGGQSFVDDRFWQPTPDKSGSGYAVIRFLPVFDEDDSIPWAIYYSYGFQGPSGKWYIEDSPTTINKEDPVAKLNSKLWNTGDKALQAEVRERSRRTNYVSNILVIKDSGDPENEGKVFLYRYGPQIFEKVQDAMSPPDDEDDEDFEIDEEIKEEVRDPFNPFDLETGANFHLRFHKEKNFRTYKKSKFGKNEPISEDESYIDNIVGQVHSLSEFTDPERFKSFEDLRKKMEEVLEIDYNKEMGVEYSPSKEDDNEKPRKKESSKTKAKEAEVSDDDEDDDEFFSNLIEKEEEDDS